MSKSHFPESFCRLAAVALTSLALTSPSAQAQSTNSPNPVAPPPPSPISRDWPDASKATPAPPPRAMTDSERALVERASARWQLLAKADFKSAYEFLTPSSRAFKPYAEFEAEAATSALREVKATRAECDSAGRCSVTLVAKAALQQPKVGMMVVPVLTQEIWALSASGEAQLILR